MHIRINTPLLVALLASAGIGATALAVAPLAQPRETTARTWSPNTLVAPITAPSLQSAPSLAIAGDKTLLAFTDSRNSGPDIYVNFLTGSERGVDQRVTNNSAAINSRRHDQADVVVEASGRAFAAYADNQRVYLARYDTAASHWLSRTQITDANLNWDQSGRSPSIASDGNGGIVVVWEGYAAGSNQPRTADVFARRCDGNALSCSPIVKLNDDTGNAVQRRPRVVMSGATVVVVWEDHRERGSEAPRIYGRGSLDGGLTWAAEGRINRDSAGGTAPTDRSAAMHPDVAIDASGIAHVVWESANSSTAPADIMATRWDGAAWAIPVRVDAAPLGTRATQPTISAGAAGVFIAWTDYRAGSRNPDIFAAKLNGTTWAEQRVTSDDKAQTRPVLATSGSSVRMAWQDERAGSQDVYTASWNGSAFAGEALAHETPERSAGQLYPSIDGSSGAVHAAFFDMREGERKAVLARLNGSTVPNWQIVSELPANDGDLSPSPIEIAGGSGIIHAAYVMWLPNEGQSIVHAAYQNGTWSDRQLVSKNAANVGKGEVSIASSATGSQAAAAWLHYGNGEQHVVYAASYKDGVWGAPEIISGAPKRLWGVRTSAAIAGNKAYVVWGDSSGNGRGSLKLATRDLSAAAGWAVTEIVPPLNSDWCGQSNPQIRADRANTLHVVWAGCVLKSPPNAWPHESWVLYSRSTDSGATWSAPARVGKSEPGDENDTSSQPALGIGLNNEVLALYPAEENGNYVFFYSFINNGTPSMPVKLSDGATNWLKPGNYFGEWHAGDGRGAVGFDPARFSLVTLFPDRRNGRTSQLYSATYGDQTILRVFMPFTRR